MITVKDIVTLLSAVKGRASAPRDATLPLPTSGEGRSAGRPGKPSGSSEETSPVPVSGGCRHEADRPPANRTVQASGLAPGHQTRPERTRYRAAPVLPRWHRPFLRSLLMAAAIPATPRAAPAGVSPRMARLIAEYRRCAEVLAAIDDAEDPIAWDAAGEAECRALKALLDQPPGTMAEYHAKFETLIPATGDDTEFHILRVLADDARVLAETTR